MGHAGINCIANPTGEVKTSKWGGRTGAWELIVKTVTLSVRVYKGPRD
jgi:hypothetical protein